MSIQVMSDGSLDIPADALEQYQIPIVEPLVIIEGKSYRSGTEITLDEFYRVQQAATREFPSTSQPAPGQFIEAFEKALSTHERVLYVGISSGLSGTINSARQAKQEFPDERIVIHDTMSISGGGGMQVVAAARAVAAGASMEEAVQVAERCRQNTDFYFTLDDLSFLIRGGRIGRVSGAVGSFLNIKPMIVVDKSDGRFQPHSRVRTFKGALRKLADLAAETVGEGQAGRFIVLYGTLKEEADELAAVLQQRFDVRYLHKVRVAPTLAAHVGWKALGVVGAKGDWEA